MNCAGTPLRLTLAAVLGTAWLVCAPGATAAESGVAHARYESPATSTDYATHGQWGGPVSPSPARGSDTARPVEHRTPTILPVQFTVAEDAESLPKAASNTAANSPTDSYEPIKLRQPGDAKSDSLKDPKAPTFAGSAITVTASLAIVLGLFFVLVWITRRNAPSSSALLSSDVVQVLGRAPLAGRQQMHLVRIGAKLLLVSVTPSGAETLTEVTDPQEVDRLAALCQQNQPGGITQSFRSLIEQMGRRTGGRQRDEATPADDAERQTPRTAAETSENWEGRRVT